MDSLAALANDSAGQRASLDALVETLSTRIGELDRTIAQEADVLFGGDGYAFLDQLNADTLLAGVHLAVPGADEAGQSLTVGSALAARYADLYVPGAFNALSTDLADSSAIFAEAAALYPDLFAIDGLAGLSESVGRDNPLLLAGTEQAQELLQLQGLEELPGYTTAATELTTAIDKLEYEIQALTAQREAEQARQLQLTQARDLAWSTFNTLSNKVAELALARTASNSEVRMGTPAVEPVDPVRGLGLVTAAALGGVVGLLLGVMLAFFANFMGQAPILRQRQATV